MYEIYKELRSLIVILKIIILFDYNFVDYKLIFFVLHYMWATFHHAYA